MESEDNNKESNVKSTIDAVTGLVKAVPVYQDTLQPAAKEIGKSLETVSKTVNIALAPIKALVWGYEKIENFITLRVSEKLENIPKENIISPQPEVAGPTIEALRFTGHNENLRELYANLLATAMDKETMHKAHPGYVEIIKGMTSDEAILLQLFDESKESKIYPLIDLREKVTDGFNPIYSNCSNFPNQDSLQRPDLIPTYINNLCRLSILEVPWDMILSDDNDYDSLRNHEILNPLKAKIEAKGLEYEYKKKMVQLTSFGKQFIDNVVLEK